MVCALRLLPFTLAIWSGCSANGPPVHFVVPNGFTGEIRLILDESGGTEIERINGKLTYQIPLNGVLHVTSFKPFEPWHVQTAAYEDGTPIPQEYETWAGPNGEEPKLGKDVVVFQGGGLSHRNDEPPVTTYFVGSTLAYEEWHR